MGSPLKFRVVNGDDTDKWIPKWLKRKQCPVHWNLLSIVCLESSSIVLNSLQIPKATNYLRAWRVSEKLCWLMFCCIGKQTSKQRKDHSLMTMRIYWGYLSIEGWGSTPSREYYYFLWSFEKSVHTPSKRGATNDVGWTGWSQVWSPMCRIGSHWRRLLTAAVSTIQGIQQLSKIFVFITK